MVKLIALATVMGLLLMVPVSASACDDEGASPPELSADDAREAILCLINERRKKAGARKLHSNDRLEQAAQVHSNSMDSDNFFSHNSPGGSSPLGRIRAAGYLAGASSWGIAENIRWGLGGQASPRVAIKRWMKSAGHRRAMLDRSYRDLGVGFTQGSPYGGAGDGAIYTVDFGYRH